VIWPKSIRRFADMNNSTVPEGLFARFEALPPLERIAAAAEAAAELSQALLEAGAPGIHLYTLNRSEASIQIAELLRH